MKRNIKKVAVLGSGVMGSAIACHMANVGLDVILLDIIPEEAKESKDQRAKNKLVNDALNKTLKSKPSPIYDKRFAKRIVTGNMTDNMNQIADCDWIIEVVIERLDIKKIVFDQVEKYRKKGTLITSNTSGIPIYSMLEGRSDDFKKHFFGTHFFNPPRYLKLLEIIPSPSTDQIHIDFMMKFGADVLGKTMVLCKDTPAFIANRVGVYAIQDLFYAVKELDLSVGEVDKLTGPIMGRPKSATFRTCDVVGLDTLVHVANGLKENCPNDERKDVFEIPDYVSKMINNGWLGSKSGQGFYKKSIDKNGKKSILELDLNSLEYCEKKKIKFPTLNLAKQEDDLIKRTQILFNGKDKAGEFYRKVFTGLFQYVSHRIPEISDEIYKIDDALKAGFGWSLGPFETWDAVGIKESIKIIEKEGGKCANWIHELINNGFNSFYKIEQGCKKYYNIQSKSYQPIPGSENTITLDSLRETSTIWSNSDVHILDLGDGIINVEFHTKMNTIGGGVLQGINKAIDLAEQADEYKGVVISNNGENFSAGANVGMIFMMAVEQEWDELDFAVRAFQNTTMRLRYSSIPVVVAPHGLTLGGGCEICLHADKVVAHAETYMGLVEFGVGLIPGGGGTKEFALRFSDELNSGDMRINLFREKFLTIGQAKVSTSGHEALELGYLRKGVDEVIVSRSNQISYAKEACLKLANKGYVQKAKRKDIKVLGKEGLGIVYVGADSMKSGNYMSQHDLIISEKLGEVLCGGDLSQVTEVSEQYLLDLERRAFLELCTERKTLERIQSLLQTGKILRN
jgi:3-hydroxyacyl-CoA dehydrogenase